jgi:hypothetical protein
LPPTIRLSALFCTLFDVLFNPETVVDCECCAFDALCRDSNEEEQGDSNEEEQDTLDYIDEASEPEFSDTDSTESENDCDIEHVKQKQGGGYESEEL